LERLLYICDWLPPDYGAVGQYSLLFARGLADKGLDVTLAGLASGEAKETACAVGRGRLRIITIRAPAYAKSSFLHRSLWTAGINTRLLWRLRWHLRKADTILFTGSPPLMIHWLGPLNVFLRRRLVYRITDFHPECAIAQKGRAGILLRALLALTVFWRRRIDEFEVLGVDQRERLEALGIDPRRIRLKRDPSPVSIGPGTRPLPRPEAGTGRLLLLYSGNWGIAHDYRTFLDGYQRHHRDGSGRFVLWLNAVGTAVDAITRELDARALPCIRGAPVPLSELASLLVTPDAHLITLSDAFVGYVLPSKVHGCIASSRPVLFIGSERSDVHLLCREQLAEADYARVDVGDAEGCWQALERMADHIEEEQALRDAGTADRKESRE
jgi:hypothetical protein